MFQVRVTDYHGDDDYCEIAAISEDDAAERFCESRDNQGDYDIIRNGEQEGIFVRRNEDSEWMEFTVTAESVPSYSAYEQ